MNSDFHYYATYCAAIIAGYTHDESLDIAYSDCFVDMCTRTLLSKIEGPFSSATTQLNLELMDTPTDVVGLQDITRIWASFHFLPKDLYAEPKQRCSKRYKNKYRLICGTNGALLADTVNLAKGKSLQAIGLAMHVLCDTWAHKTFAGTPSQVINGPYNVFYEIMPDGSEKQITFRHTASMPDDLDQCIYTCSLAAGSENSIMNLGHGRAGHLPDYSFIKYRYLPAWGGYEEIVKDNQSDFFHAFCQMIYALKYLRGEYDRFETDRFDFDAEKYQEEYLSAGKDEKDDTFLGRFIIASLAQKSMVTNRIYNSGNKLAGYSVDYGKRGFRGIRDFKKLVKELRP